jgi:DNA ligase-1
MLAKEYTKDMKTPKALKDNVPPIGWLLSEKFDGYRARWIPGKRIFLSRNQKEFIAPEWFKDAMPNVDLDGELFAGREFFQYMGTVRKKVPVDDEWKKIKYMVYDMPEEDNVFGERIKKLEEVVKDNGSDIVVFAKQIVITSIPQMEKIYKTVLEKGGEGIMMKCPSSQYEDKRSNFMLKYKPSFDSEAVIVDYHMGNGKYDGVLGGFMCKPLLNYDTYSIIDPDENHEFSISGMDDSIRESYKSTHPVGTIITYEYSGKTDSGKPRFPRYLRIREDINLKEGVVSSEKKNRVIKIFTEIMDHEFAQGEKFKGNSYKKVLPALKKLSSDYELSTDNLKKINGLGKGLLEKIEQIKETDTCPLYDKIKDYHDPKKDFMNIHGVGPKNAEKLVKSGFTSIDDLRKCKDIGEHLNDVQQLGLKYYEDMLIRIPREEIFRHENYLKQIIKILDVPKGSVHFTIAGSYRRGKEDSGDIDILFSSKSKKKYDEFIDKLKEANYLVDDLARGPKKYNGMCRYGRNACRRIDIMYTKPCEYPFAIMYFTGSMEFNTMVRQKCLDRGLSLNEYSLKDNNTKKVVDHKFVLEKDIFDYLGMEYVEPEKR